MADENFGGGSRVLVAFDDSACRQYVTTSHIGNPIVRHNVNRVRLRRKCSENSFAGESRRLIMSDRTSSGGRFSGTPEAAMR